MKANPFGDLIPEVGPYYKNDIYGDNHPVFNHSVLYSIHVSVADQDLEYCLDKYNVYNQSDVSANFSFSNGNH